MSENWTKGPWEIQKYFEPYDDHHPFTNVVKDGLIVAKLGLDLCEEFEANATLIAAAPDLYAALERIYGRLLMSDRDGDARITEEDGAMAEAALRKARGEE